MKVESWRGLSQVIFYSGDPCLPDCYSVTGGKMVASPGVSKHISQILKFYVQETFFTYNTKLNFK